MENKYNSTEPILEIQNLSIGFLDENPPDKVVNGLSLSIHEGEMVGIVGESGSGKSMTALSVLGLLPNRASVMEGSIRWNGTELLNQLQKRMNLVKGSEISMIFQEPMTSLNPVKKIGVQVEEMLRLHTNYNKEKRRKIVFESLEEVGLQEPEIIYHKYPHQLSGGMRQRVMTAMAMICRPKLLIADEPTTALDATIQAQILALLKHMNETYHTAILLISHDLGVIKHTCSRAVVMQNGNLMEEGFVNQLFSQPRNEYTKTLMRTFKKPEVKAMVSELTSSMGKNILKVEDLNVYYMEKSRKFLSSKEKRKIVKNVSFMLEEGEIVGIVGESGSGKSTLLKAIAGIAEKTDGRIELNGERPAMVFQDPYSSLNPVKTVEWILEEPLRIQGVFTKQQRKQKVSEMLNEVGLKKEHGKRKIQQLSGGQRQRVSIANALICNAKIILLDEPVSALDVTVQEQILQLLLQLSGSYGLSYLFVSHDLKVIEKLCHRVCIMYQGELIETGCVNEIFANPKTEYTKKLLNAVLN